MYKSSFGGGLIPSSPFSFQTQADSGEKQIQAITLPFEKRVMQMYTNNMDEKSQFLSLIRSNIDKYRYHITIVGSSIEPRFAYTIGLSNLFGFELIFAGGVIFRKHDMSLIFDTVFEELKIKKTLANREITIDALGTFSFSFVDSSWNKLMMLGVFDFYKTGDIKAFQIIPDSNHYTLDIPNMSNQWNVSSEPVWQWLVRKWDYPVPENSTVVTNIDALLGESITEVVRWEDDAWEMFAGAGPDVPKEDARVVPLGTILGIDKTLLPAIDLGIGKGLWRNSGDDEWHDWE